MAQAETAIHRGEPWRARLILNPYLRSFPDDADAWILHATSRVQEQDYRRVIRELESIATIVEETPVLGMILSLSYARTGRREEAIWWAKVADQDPLVGARLRAEADFVALHTRGVDAVNGAGVDPSYG